MAELPTGTLTFVFSDIEGSTRLLRRLGDAYGAVLEEHQRLLREAFVAHGGHEVDTHGDSFFVAFLRPRNAIPAAIEAQRALGSHRWPEGAEPRVRVGIHTGPAEPVGDRYVGLAVHRAARVCAVGRGGQVLVSPATRALLEDEVDELAEIELRDLGEHRLKDFDRPVRVYQVVAAGLEADSRPLRTSGREPESADPDRLPAIRASDADREKAVTALREHAAAGRLTLEELSERSEQAYGATTLAELEEIGLDLPPAAMPAERPRRRPKRFTGVFFGDLERTGRWRLPRRSLAVVVFSNADLDLRQAELDGTTASITAFVLFGNIDLYVPEGVEVDLGGLCMIGHRRESGRDVPPRPGTPLVRVHIFSLFGTADVWRVPLSWVGKTFREVIRSLRRGEQRELPSGG